MVFHLLGINSFIGKNIYIELKKQKIEVLCYSHSDINNLELSDNDYIINCCGINKGQNYEEFKNGNVNFLKKILEKINNKNIYLIHLSSGAVNGFKNIDVEQLNNGMKFFIKSKLEGEKYLLDNYNKENLLIIRPSNIYGYNCEPYYNNILVSLVYDKIKNFEKINNLNKNCVRNFLSIEGFVNKTLELIENKYNGIYNIISSNNNSLNDIINYLYEVKPKYININDDEESISNIDFNNNIIVNENIIDKLNLLENKMLKYYEMKDNITIEKLNELIQPRGNMIEISNLESKRLYKITLTKNSVRGNHYHEEQIEDFFVNNGFVYFILANKNDLDVIYQFKLNKNEKVKIKPYIIHTLLNDYINNEPEIMVLSTQKYIKDIVLDTVYKILI
jgi:nucleoside-diphosphate-sugar epimerase